METKGPFIIALAMAVLILTASTFPVEALVQVTPDRPTHEDDIKINYTPGPADNTTVVRLILNINNTTTKDLDITKHRNNATGAYTYDLGVFAQGTAFSYSVVAWNMTVGEGNISVASVIDVLWHRDLQVAKALARHLGRPLLLLFWTGGERSSFDMITKTFDDVRVLNLTASFVCVNLRLDDGPDLARQWNITLAPTLVFLDNRSNEVHRVTGPLTSDQLLAHLRYALGTGPRPKEKVNGLYGDPTRNLLIATFLLLVVVGVILFKARGRSQKPY
jgi:hypothetical protein